MLLKAAPAFSLLNTRGDSLGPLFSSASSLSNNNLAVSPSILRSKTGSGFLVCASKGATNKSLIGVVFKPFEEVKKELNLVPTLPHVSLARQKFTDESEAAINQQIKWGFFFLVFLLSDSSFAVKEWIIFFNWCKKRLLYFGAGLKILFFSLCQESFYKILSFWSSGLFFFHWFISCALFCNFCFSVEDRFALSFTSILSESVLLKYSHVVFFNI